jgi:hypothetical protein
MRAVVEHEQEANPVKVDVFFGTAAVGRCEGVLSVLPYSHGTGP